MGYRIALWLSVLTWLGGIAANAGSFQVLPVKVYLDGRTPTAVVRVINQGEEPLTVQLEAKRWRQDESGEDVYEDTAEIAFFPLLFTLEKDAERVVRIGYRGPPPVERERTFRLFLEELPVVTPGKTELRFALRIGVPIFVVPPEERTAWSAVAAPIERGRAEVRVTNDGNRHLVLTRLSAVGHDAAGAELLNKARDGWYVLAGSTRPFALPLEEGVCRQLADLRMTVSTADQEQAVAFEPPSVPEQCAPPPTADRTPPQGVPPAN